MGKFKEASWKVKIILIIQRIREIYLSHLKARLPNSKYKLLDLIRMENSYNGMSIGRISQYIAGRGFIKSGQTVLDVGCGSACHAKYFIETGIDYYGMDLSETAIAVALLKYPKKNFFNCSIYDVQNFYKPELFDVIYCSAMLEHIGNWELAIRNMLYLAKDKVIICFFDGLSSVIEKNYYEFHPFKDKKLLDFHIVLGYGYKPVITKQLSNISAYVFDQPGNYRVPISIASKLCKLSREALMRGKFDYDSFSETVSMRLILYYAQNNNKDFQACIPKLPGFIEKRYVSKEERGYFMNRFSKKELISWIESQYLKYNIYDYKRINGKEATIIVIQKR